MASDLFRRLSARERWVVTAGVLVSAAAVLLVLVVLPLARRWTDREAAIDARREQISRLEGLLRGEESIRRALDETQRAHAPLGARLLTGTTPEIAASNLQALVQGYADRSRVTLERIDLAADAKAVDQGLPEIPVQLSGQGDIYGLADLLSLLQHGERLLVTDEIRVNAGLGLDAKAELLTWSIRLHGPYLAQ